MLNEMEICDIWTLFSPYIDKKQQDINVLAERYIELLVDMGVTDRGLENAMGTDDILDEAIKTYLPDPEDDEEEELDF